MPDLAQGYSANVVLNAGESVRVSTTGQATVTSAYGAPTGTTTINASSQTFGPYQVPAKLRVTAVSGTANYAQPTQVPVTVDQSTNTVLPPGAVSGAGSPPSALKAAVEAYATLGVRSRPPIVMGIFDSNGAGQGAGTGGTGAYIGAWANAPMQQIKDSLPSLGGCELINTAWACDGNMSVNAGFTASGYDPRVTLIGTAAYNATPEFLGGRRLVMPAQGDGITINFGQRIDTVEVYSIQRSVATGLSSAMQIKASDGTVIGADYSQQTAGADALVRETRTSAKFNDGIVTVMNNAVGQPGQAFLVIGYPTNKKVAVVVSGAWASGRVANLASNTQVYSGVNFHSSIQPDATIMALIINDTGDGLAAATYNSTLVTILDKLKLYGDLAIATSCMCGFANYTNGTYGGLRTELIRLAKTYNAKFLPVDTLFGSYAAAVAAGYMYDDRHGTKPNYGLQASSAFAPWLRSLVA